jgi:glucose/arabinose dehydrogenase
MEFAPDGRLFVSEQGGSLRVIKDGQMLSQPFLTLNVDSQGERGLLGIAFDPNFASNGYVYVYHTVPGTPAHNRVSRFTASGDVAAPGSAVDIFDVDPLSSDTRHNGGAIHFGPDGDLYIAVGDNKVGANAQSLTSLMGKILRIKPDGSIPTDNPFYTRTTGVDRAIWAMGLRNPYTFAFGTDSQANPRMFINDVGEDTWEKIDPGLAGANYGWPNTENATGSSQYTNPLFAYNHGINEVNGCAITGGAFYNPTTVQFPAAYTGSYFFSDYCGSWIHRFDPVTRTETDFGSQLPGGTVDLKVDSAGRLYYLAGAGTSSGEVVRIDYSPSPPPPPGNPPSIVQQPSNQSVIAGNPATFSIVAMGSGSLAYQWQRNGQNILGAGLPTYVLPSAKASDNGARYSILVSNFWGTTSSSSATLFVTVPQPPVPTITSPSIGSNYVAGQTINFSGVATDPGDGVLAASALSWQVDRHDSTGVHTVLGPTSDIASGTFLVPQQGDLSVSVFYRFTLTARDSAGLSRSTFLDVNPLTTSLFLSTQPGGLPIFLDSQPIGTPSSVRGVAGMTRTLQAPASQVSKGVIYQFVGWSDGATLATRILAFPSLDSSTSALYQAVGIVPYVTVREAHENVGRGRIQSLVVSFDGPIDPSTARIRDRYWIVLPGRDRKFGTRDDRIYRFRTAVYSAATNSVRLVPSIQIPPRQMFQLVAAGSGSRGVLSDIYGRPIDGNSDNQPGGNFVATFGPGVTRVSRSGG